MKLSLMDRLRGKVELPDQAKSLSVSPEVVATWQMFGGPGGAGPAIYRRQPAVRTVVDFLARNIGSLNPKVYERVGDDDRRERDDHPLANVLRNPNPATTRFRHFRDTVADIAIHDRAFWWKQRSGGQVVSVLRLAPPRILFERDTRTGEQTIRDTRTGRVFPAQDLIVFSGYSPEGDDLGVSPMETLRRVLAEEWAAIRHRENMWRNSARQGAVIRRPSDAPPWGEDERKRFRTDWEAMMTGAANSGKTAILEDGMQLDGFSAFNPKEMEYIAGRRLTYEEVAVAYGGVALASLIAGKERGTTGTEVDSFHRQLYQDVLGPWLRMIQDEIELQLLPEFDVRPGATQRRVYVEFSLAEKLKGSFEEQAAVLATSVGVPFMTVNDARSRLNMSRVVSGDAEVDALFDVPVMPMNVLYGGQQSTQEPTADPSTPPGLLARGWKAAPRGAMRRRRQAAEIHTKFLEDFFARQERAVVSALGGKALGDAWNADRWNDELSSDLFRLAQSTTRRNGQLAADQIGGVYDHQRTVAYLAERSRVAAESINETTHQALADTLADEDPDVENVFTVAKTSRAEQIGLTTATGLIAFAREEAGRHTADAQGREVLKTWVVTSGKSRHPEMNGEAVPVGETFSNGALWPGDPSLGTDQTAGCSCLMQIA